MTVVGKLAKLEFASPWHGSLLFIYNAICVLSRTDVPTSGIMVLLGEI
jgi:hypothetical protein